MSLEVYQKDPLMIVKLRSNYRSHERILELPSRLFYGRRQPWTPTNVPKLLQVHSRQSIHHLPLSW